MDTPPEERALFDHVTCNISALVDEVTSPGALALDLIEQVGVLYRVKLYNCRKIANYSLNLMNPATLKG